MKIGMLIPTRNRPESLDELLTTLDEAIVSQVVVSSSGSDIAHVISRHSNRLHIVHVVCGPGQIWQKIQGIGYLSDDLDWVIFSDDDLKFKEDFFTKLVEKLTQIPIEIKGVGMNIHSNLKDAEPSKQYLAGRIFGLQNGIPGEVKRNGECVKYIQSSFTIETNWLNGASIWRRDTVSCYGSPGSKSRYAAYEDAIFSFEIAKSGKLLYVPEIQAEYGHEDSPTKISSGIIRAVIYWKIYFVVHNELSLPKCLWSVFGTSLIFIANNQSHEKLTARISTVMSIWSKVSLLLFLKNPETKIIEIIESELSVD